MSEEKLKEEISAIKDSVDRQQKLTKFVLDSLEEFKASTEKLIKAIKEQSNASE